MYYQAMQAAKDILAIYIYIYIYIYIGRHAGSKANVTEHTTQHATNPLLVLEGSLFLACAHIPDNHCLRVFVNL